MLGVDLNCDMGESTGLWHYDINKDIELLNYVSSINIACGFHAGDSDTMQLLTGIAIKNKVAIGAHPSFPDKVNFGRTNMELSRQRIYEIVKEQIIILNEIVKRQDGKMHHVKPHGALYNMASKDRIIANAICKAVHDIDASIILYGLSGSELITAAAENKLKNYSEVFADRTYQDDGSLTPRTAANALMRDTNRVAAQVIQMIKHKTVTSLSGREVPIRPDTVCIHGDSIHAVEFAKTIYSVLKSNDIRISAEL
ncbi:MAG TPA: 5-oxoprolinase subunit PxpA [Puia sp.]|nr:5-oxoprolinase subunit PxpA [Puia sp.]